MKVTAAASTISPILRDGRPTARLMIRARGAAPSSSPLPLLSPLPLPEKPGDSCFVTLRGSSFPTPVTPSVRRRDVPSFNLSGQIPPCYGGSNEWRGVKISGPAKTMVAGPLTKTRPESESSSYRISRARSLAEPLKQLHCLHCIRKVSSRVVWMTFLPAVPSPAAFVSSAPLLS